jgi:hypothetical protein
MNDSQMNWLRMFRKVKGVFSENGAITDKYPPIGASFNTFGGQLDEIELVSAADSRSTKGTFEEKQDRKGIMASEASSWLQQPRPMRKIRAMPSCWRY